MKQELKDALALIGIVLIWLLSVAFVIGIFYLLFAVPTHFIIEIINAIKA